MIVGKSPCLVLIRLLFKLTISVARHLDVKLSVGSIKVSLIEAIAAVPGVVTERAALLIA